MEILKIKKDFLLHIEDKKELLVLYYMWIKEDKEKNISFSINELVEYWEYSPHRDKGRINQIFRNILLKFKNNNIIHTSCNFDIIKNNHKITAKILNNNENIFFVTLTIHEMNKIKECIQLNTSIKKIHIEKLLYVYLLIKSHMNFSPNCVPLCYLSIDKIVSLSGFSKPTVEKYIKLLQENNIIQKYNLGYFKNTKGYSVIIPTVYTLNPVDVKTIKNNIKHILYNFESWGEDAI